ncbi:MAG TPA: DUF255 domain-containing protein [Natrialbaceae archaeon]|nr:DUF255 domain-containing protein [Natrialbaceae archaeon]
MDHATGDSKVDWREWGHEPFEYAAVADRPVLLSLSAPWCSSCLDMDAETYGEPRIAARVGDSFVPIRVDVDRRPRVRDRYNMGGFPTTAFLAPDGTVLAATGYLDADEMRDTLDRVEERWEDDGASAGTGPRVLEDADPPSAEVTGEIEAFLAGRLSETFDHEHGGWGEGAKFPAPRTVEFALKREREGAKRTLDAIGANLQDDDGGFFRYAAKPDWSAPSREKLLDTNAALVRAFANAYLSTGEDAYRRTADRGIEYLTTTLWTGEAFGGSERIDGDDTGGDGGVDPTVFADRNGMAVDALLTYHAYTDDERARGYAERALEHLRSERLEDGVPVHYRDGAETGPRGLLGDAAQMMAALTTAREVLGADTLADARTLADATIEQLHDERGFVDGPVEGPALLDRPLRPIDDNYEMAAALLDLHALTGVDRYREAARDAIAAFAGARDRMGVQVAGYGSVAARLVGPTLRIEVGTPAGSDLHRAALRVGDHEKVVVPAVADLDGTARVIVGETVSDPVATPRALADRVAEMV